MKPNFERSLGTLLLLCPLLFGAKGGCGSGGTLNMGHDNPNTGECSEEDCGPAPGIPNWQCDDGTLAGPSCVRDEEGTCGFRIIECPSTCEDVPQCEFQCPSGSINPTDAAGCVHTCECVPASCTWEDCPSPAPGAPNYTCPDGTLAGPACLPSGDGSCGWRFIECSTEVCLASLPEAGASCTVVGVSCTYPGDSNELGDWHQTAVCESSGGGQTWQIATHYDRVACTLEAESTGALDVSDCAERSFVQCSMFPGQTQLEALTRAISATTDECGGIPNEGHLQVDFQTGCASKITFESPGPFDEGPLFTCMTTRLASQRFSCAEAVDCARLDPSTVR